MPDRPVPEGRPAETDTRAWALDICSRCGHSRTGSWLPKPCPVCGADSGFEKVRAVPLSRLEAAEGERDAEHARAERIAADYRTLAEDFRAVSEVGMGIAGERDRLREALQRIARREVPGGGGICLPEQATVEVARAALSTGDRQDDDFGVRTGVPTQPAQARHETAGGAL